MLLGDQVDKMLRMLCKEDMVVVSHWAEHMLLAYQMESVLLSCESLVNI